MTSATKKDGINAAMSVAEDIAAGTVDPAALEAEMVSECRALFGTVAGPRDALFALQIDVARQVLAAGGISATEVAEWAAVLKRRVGDAETPGGDVSSASGAHSAGNDVLDVDPETEQ